MRAFHINKRYSLFAVQKKLIFLFDVKIPHRDVIKQMRKKLSSVHGFSELVVI